MMFISPQLTNQHNSQMGVPIQPDKSRKKKVRGDGGRSLHNDPHRKGRRDSVLGRYSRKPRVVGIYAYQLNEVDERIMKENKNYLPPYMYLTERIDPHLLSHTSQTLRRIRRHDYVSGKTALSDIFHNYKLAIVGSNSYIKSEDPLKHLMLSSNSRDTLRVIENDSEDYEGAMATPLDDEECEATPENAKWMLHSSPTCNFLHEFDILSSLNKDKTKILGSGYWRDVWPALDSEPSSQLRQKKVALKTIRYEHDYTERNYHRHERDAIVGERLTSSPQVTAIYSFCGNSGYYEFATGGSLADRFEAHYKAMQDAESEDEETGKRNTKNDDQRLLDQYTKLSLAHQAAAGLADLHDADAMRDENGEITSAAMVHADIKAEQFVNIGGVYKLNDFNRCRFMRRYRNSAESGGDGKPCGFKVGNNSGAGRSPEEYAYEEETEKIDVYSLGNIFYTLLTDMDAWEDWPQAKAIKAIQKGKRPEIPSSKLSSIDVVDVALRKVMYQCWKHKPEDRPRARALADFLSKELNALSSKKKIE
eukprot:CAMPEP_0172313680 /NCGR_PEP_ID=MMETSP1058-20130122/20754_1 /TAXON_ID=83371 /ORGANISM="Detonula confervacea, Strain CCMP 353" /LENGTH=533 /DNA_ID=CAMNT_0013027377 /DNA_START=226 /DNA_END=1827 /DNA_ORIENTATION=-